LLVLIAHENWEVDQMDIKNAYLKGELEEKIYMEQPPGFAKPGEGHKVCLLRKTIYGLKQSEQCWYKWLCNIFAKLKLMHCSVDHGIFWCQLKNGIIIVTASVDDLAIFM
ncbi:hypothetical protein HETIRDRAFT_247684, partial [Heterobasidion irregulare TC 32-1]